jgi:hypothetical protein
LVLSGILLKWDDYRGTVWLDFTIKSGENHLTSKAISWVLSLSLFVFI